MPNDDERLTANQPEPERHAKSPRNLLIIGAIASVITVVIGVGLANSMMHEVAQGMAGAAGAIGNGLTALNDDRLCEESNRFSGPSGKCAVIVPSGPSGASGPTGSSTASPVDVSMLPKGWPSYLVPKRGAVMRGVVRPTSVSVWFNSDTVSASDLRAQARAAGCTAKESELAKEPSELGNLSVTMNCDGSSVTIEESSGVLIVTRSTE